MPALPEAAGTAQRLEAVKNTGASTGFGEIKPGQGRAVELLNWYRTQVVHWK